MNHNRFEFGRVAGQPIQITQQRWIGQQLDRPVEPARNMGGMDANGNLPEEDKDLLDKTQHVRRRGERLIQLIARVGISPLQIRDWDKSRIADFVAQVEQNAEHREPKPARSFEQRQPTPRFPMVLGGAR